MLSAPSSHGDRVQTTWDEGKFEGDTPSEEVLLVDAALEKMEEDNPDFARIVKLRYFAGLDVAETAQALGVSKSTIDRSWRAAKAWLFREISGMVEDPLQLSEEQHDQ